MIKQGFSVSGEVIVGEMNSLVTLVNGQTFVGIPGACHTMRMEQPGNESLGREIVTQVDDPTILASAINRGLDHYIAKTENDLKIVDAAKTVASAIIQPMGRLSKAAPVRSQLY
jgi:hypothetical protein